MGPLPLFICASGAASQPQFPLVQTVLSHGLLNTPRVERFWNIRIAFLCLCFWAVGTKLSIEGTDTTPYSHHSSGQRQGRWPGGPWVVGMSRPRRSGYTPMAKGGAPQLPAAMLYQYLPSPRPLLPESYLLRGQPFTASFFSFVLLGTRKS